MVGVLLVTVIGVALLVAASFRARSQLSDFNRIRSHSSPSDDGRLGGFLRPYRLPLGAASTLTLTLTVVDLAAPWPFAVIIDNAIGGQPLPTWLSPLNALSHAQLAAVAALASVVLLAASLLLAYLTQYLNGATQARIGADLRTAGFLSLQRASIAYHDENRTGDLVSRLSADVSRVEEMLVAWFETALPETLKVIGMIAVMTLIDVKLTLLALAVVPLLALWAYRTHSTIQRVERRARDQSGLVADHATEALQHIRAVQAFAREAAETQRFRETTENAARSEMEAIDTTARLGPIADLVLAAGSGLVMYVGAVQVIDGSLTIGVLFVMLAYLNQLYDPITGLSTLVVTMARGAASRARLLALFASDSAVAEAHDAVEVPPGAARLALRSVGFSYPNGRTVLRNVSFSVRAGEMACVVGPTGAGKSTLLALMLRLYDPSSGSIELNGVDLRRLTIASVRDKIAVVPQDMWLADGTVYDNIAFGASDPDPDAILHAARLALVDEFVTQLPAGYETVVGEGGTQLSGGERRRVALARALVRGAPILLLDEPTSGLDGGTEARVIEAILRAADQRAVVVVSHHLELARVADRVVVLEGGNSVEAGSHDDLLRRGARYAALWRDASIERDLPLVPVPEGSQRTSWRASSSTDERG